jgi:glucose/mannose-6-phosphate isomerase
MNIIDDRDKIKKIDTLDMLGVEEGFYDQLTAAVKIASDTKIKPLKNKNFKGIAIAGMGGSGFTGDIIKSIISGSINIPVEVFKGYGLPPYAGKEWLVFAVSYSGNTEETIASLKGALDNGSDAVCVSAGGELSKIAENHNLTHVKIPGGFQPRGAAGYLFFSTLLVMDKMGIISVSSQDKAEALELVGRLKKIYNRDVATADNPAKKLAVDLYGRLPVIYGVNGYLSTVVYRWKCQINENAKCPCFVAEFPELNHNEIVGWQNLADVFQNFALVVFKDNSYTGRIRTRISTTVELVRDCFDALIEVEIEGNSLLARALSAIYLGGISSVYLALLYQTDPTPIKRIEALKAALAKLD